MGVKISFLLNLPKEVEEMKELVVRVRVARAGEGGLGEEVDKKLLSCLLAFSMAFSRDSPGCFKQATSSPPLLHALPPRPLLPSPPAPPAPWVDSATSLSLQPCTALYSLRSLENSELAMLPVTPALRGGSWTSWRCCILQILLHGVHCLEKV